MIWLKEYGSWPQRTIRIQQVRCTWTDRVRLRLTCQTEIECVVIVPAGGVITITYQFKKHLRHWTEYPPGTNSCYWVSLAVSDLSASRCSPGIWASTNGCLLRTCLCFRTGMEHTTSPRRCNATRNQVSCLTPVRWFSWQRNWGCVCNQASVWRCSPYFVASAGFFYAIQCHLSHLYMPGYCFWHHSVVDDPTIFVPPVIFFFAIFALIIIVQSTSSNVGDCVEAKGSPHAVLFLPLLLLFWSSWARRKWKKKKGGSWRKKRTRQRRRNSYNKSECAVKNATHHGTWLFKFGHNNNKAMKELSIHE